jgi:hypothetical protein
MQNHHLRLLKTNIGNIMPYLKTIYQIYNYTITSKLFKN